MLRTSYRDPVEIDAEGEVCVVCGRSRHGVEPPERWLDVEVFRADEKGVLDEQAGSFCSQEHAAEWLLRPLPPIPDGRPPPAWGWRDRLVESTVIAGFGLCAALCLLGVATAVHWLIS